MGAMRQSEAGVVGLVMKRSGTVDYGRHGPSGNGAFRYEVARQSWNGKFMYGAAWIGRRGE